MMVLHSLSGLILAQCSSPIGPKSDKYVNRAINQRFASHGRRAYKKWAARTLSHGFFMGPHMRRMHKFYAKHYGRKANNRALKLERLMWAGGNKRVNDGQF